MRNKITALALAASLAPLAGFANPAEDDESQEAKWARLASHAKPGPCPTEIEILPYQWIEPATGIEYTMLRLHCPGRDELEGDTSSDRGALDADDRIPASVRSAG